MEKSNKGATRLIEGKGDWLGRGKLVRQAKLVSRRVGFFSM